MHEEITYFYCMNTLSVWPSAEGKNYATPHFRHQSDKQPASRLLLQFFSCRGLLECTGSQGEQQQRHVSGNREHSVCQRNSQEEISTRQAPVLLLLVEPAWACGGSTDMGLCMAAQKGSFVMKYYVVLSPTAPEHPSVPPQGRGQKQTEKQRK